MVNRYEQVKDMSTVELREEILRLDKALAVISKANVAPPEIRSTDWLSGIGVLGWKRVMSRELFETEDAARQWAESHGLKEVEYIPASMPKMPDNVAISCEGGRT